jgi:zinc transport system ATP-binding protein
VRRTKNVNLWPNINEALEHSLIVRLNAQTVFTSDQHWLYPLFELEDFLKNSELSTSDLFLSDKIAGKAAACLIVFLGIKRCHIELLSERAIPVFKANQIEFTYDHLVDHIQCRTEDLITDKMNISDAYLFLRKRAGRVQGLSVKMENVSVRIEEKLVINQLNFDLGRGEQLIIHGANGAGKTTLLRAMLGFIPIVDGNIKIGDYFVGSDLWSLNRSIIGYVHQENIKNNFPISSGEVVQIGLGKSRISKSETDYRVEVAMRRTGSFHLIDQPYHTLSGGEKQRVSLARCLCQNARVFLLDEPTSFLDQQGKDDLLLLLHELSQNEAPSMVLVSHDLQWIEQLNWPRKELKGGRLC